MQILYQELAPYFRSISDFLTVTDAEISILRKIFEKNKVKNVLDVACGAGRHSVPLAQLGYEVMGIDYSQDQIREARLYAKQKAVRARFFVKNANNFSFPNQFDAAICMWTTIGEEPMEYDKVIRNVYSSLKNGGVFVIDNNTWEHIPKSGEQYIKNRTRVGKYILEQLIYDRFTEHFRIRESTIKIRGKTYHDLCITHIKKPHEWAEELKKAGFTRTKIIPNYGVKKGGHTKRNVLIVGIK